MKFIGTELFETGHALPRRKIDNPKLYEIIKAKGGNWDVERARGYTMGVNLSEEKVFDSFYLKLGCAGSRYFASEKEPLEYLGAEAARQTLTDNEKPDLIVTAEFTSKGRKEIKKIPNSGLLLAHDLGNDTTAAFSLNTINQELVEKVHEAFAKNYDKILAVTQENSNTNFKLITNGVEYFSSSKWNEFEDVAKEAKRVLSVNRVSSSELELVIYSFITKEDAGSSIAKLLGLNVDGLSVNTACSGFPYGVAIADCLIRNGNYRDIIVTAVERMSDVIDFEDYKTLALFGDGAGAARFKATNNPKKAIKFFLSSYYSESDITLDIGKEDKLQMIGGRKVVSKAVNAMEYAAYNLLLQGVHKKEELRNYNIFNLGKNEAIKEELKELLKEIQVIVPHDANKRISDLLADKFLKELGFPKERVYWRIVYEGNCSGASAAKNLDFARRENIVKENDAVLITTVGGGYTIGSLELKMPEKRLKAK